MDFEKIKLTDIVPAEYNPRKISEEEYYKLKESITKFGLVDPIIINLKNNRIIGGHQRYDVLMDKYINNEISNELYLFKVGNIGWVTSDNNLMLKDEDLEKELLVRLNVQSGMWDYDKLNEIFTELDLNGFDVSVTGFLPTEINIPNDDDLEELFDTAEDEIEDDIEEEYDDIILTSQNNSYILEFSSPEQEMVWNNFIEYINKNDDAELLSQKILDILGGHVGEN
mgnify:CR=1 FL=1